METSAKKQAINNYHHGHAIKSLRRDKKWSQNELGNLVGLTQQKIYQIEKEKELDDELLARIAKGLNVSPDFIKELEDEKPLASYIENCSFTNSPNIAPGSSVGTIQYSDESQLMKIALEKLEKSYEESRKQAETIAQGYKEMIEFLKKENQELKAKISQLESVK